MTNLAKSYFYFSFTPFFFESGFFFASDQSVSEFSVFVFLYEKGIRECGTLSPEFRIFYFYKFKMQDKECKSK